MRPLHSTMRPIRPINTDLLTWLRSPVLHFLVLGFLIFVLNEAREVRLAAEESGSIRVEIDATRIETLERDFATQMGRAPNAQEEEALLATGIEEEILFREALARGLLEHDGGVQTRLIQKMLFLEGQTELENMGDLLDRAMKLKLYQDDIVVRRILVQKIRFMASALDDEERPSAEDIAERYARDRNTYREPDRISFGLVFLSIDVRRDATRGDALALRDRLESESILIEEAISLGDPFPLGYRFSRLSERDLARRFGSRFGTLALECETGEWSEPIESAYGQHLLYIESRESGVIPSLDAMSDRIRRELEHEFQKAKFSTMLRNLKKRYEVVVTGYDQGTR